MELGIQNLRIAEAEEEVAAISFLPEVKSWDRHFGPHSSLILEPFLESLRTRNESKSLGVALGLETEVALIHLILNVDSLERSHSAF